MLDGKGEQVDIGFNHSTQKTNEQQLSIFGQRCGVKVVVTAQNGAADDQQINTLRKERPVIKTRSSSYGITEHTKTKDIDRIRGFAYHW
ncbi:hypothetical protein JFY74_13555 [Pectobacterium carotovorum]|uniref:hypothetical protein n=1 Tax=Pectobacterium versatile TaxID=2488639 RepID=UPI001304B1AB|nr:MULTISPECIES: hypothetical protein [Pectobacterium]QQG27142.1 hypothetical protein JFY74_13555 [Pectobacterium carotovorum]